jgi:hypothetical protein
MVDEHGGTVLEKSKSEQVGRVRISAGGILSADRDKLQRDLGTLQSCHYSLLSPQPARPSTI